MKEQLIEMGFYPGRTKYFVYYGLENGVLWVNCVSGLVEFEDTQGRFKPLATDASIEQISNILKSIQI
jgi:hypothetical protein